MRTARSQSSLLVATAVPVAILLLPTLGEARNCPGLAPDNRVGYVALRRLEATTLKNGQHAWLEARTTFDPSVGRLIIHILAEGGSDAIRRRVLHAALNRERELVAKRAPLPVPIVSERYLCKAPVPSPAGLWRIDVTPRRRDDGLIRGSVLMDARRDLRRMQGSLARTPSFWVKAVDIDWQFARVDGAVLPVRLDAMAQVKIVGPSSFQMTLDYEQVNGRPIPTSQRRMLMAAKQ